MVTVLELERPSGAAAQSLPSVTVSVQGDDPTRHSEIATILLAAQAERPRQTEHSDGLLNGQVFTFYTEPAARITAIAERQKPLVVFSQWPSGGEGIAVVEVFATPTMPETVVVYYVGDSDPRDSIDAARSIVSSRMAGAETATVQQPNIVLVGHPGRGVDDASFADGLNRAICKARCDKPADRRWQLPSNATLFVQDPADKPRVVAALREMRLNSIERLSSATAVPLAQLRAYSDEQLAEFLQAEEQKHGYGDSWYEDWRSAVQTPAVLAAGVRQVDRIEDAFSETPSQTPDSGAAHRSPAARGIHGPGHLPGQGGPPATGRGPTLGR